MYFCEEHVWNEHKNSRSGNTEGTQTHSLIVSCSSDVEGVRMVTVSRRQPSPFWHLSVSMVRAFQLLMYIQLNKFQFMRCFAMMCDQMDSRLPTRIGLEDVTITCFSFWVLWRVYSCGRKLSWWDTVVSSDGSLTTPNQCTEQKWTSVALAWVPYPFKKLPNFAVLERTRITARNSLICWIVCASSKGKSSLLSTPLHPAT